MVVAHGILFFVVGITRIHLAYIAIVVAIDGIIHGFPWSQAVEACKPAGILDSSKHFGIGDKLVVPSAEHVALRTSYILLALVRIGNIAHCVRIGRMVDVIEIAHKVAPLHSTRLWRKELVAAIGICAKQGTASDV